MTTDASSRAAEAVAAGLAGGVLAGAVGSLFGVGTAAAAVGAANGALSGWRRVYAWRDRRGVLAFGLDSTWSLASTTAALASHVLSAARGRPGFVAGWSERRNRHVYARGFVPRRGFALTMGNVVTGAADASGDLSERRRKLVDDHEDQHVWQARALGPVYPVTYVGWTVLGGVAGVVVWFARGRREPLGRVVDSCAYYANPYEWWAYSRDGQWPPSKAVSGLVWRRPLAAALPRQR